MSGFKIPRQEIFLTGATGVLGAHLLKEILMTSECTVHCLVRAANREEGIIRLRELLSVYDPEATLAAEFEARVIPVLGNIASPLLGLSETDYAELQNRVGSVLHAAASTSLFSTFKQMEPVNVGGVKNMIEFTLGTPSKYMCFVSTYTVQGSKTFDPNFIFKEEHLDVGQEFPYMAYQQSKFIAENLVREAKERGLKWNIVRPGQIFGEQDTGRYPQGQVSVSGLFLDLIKTVIETGVAMRSEVHFDVTPVDFVSRGTLFLGLVRDSLYETYHLVNPDVRTYSEMIEVLQSLGYQIKFVTQEAYKELLFSRQLVHKEGEVYRSPTIRSFKWWFRRDPFNFTASSITDATYTCGILREADVNCPPIDRKLLGTYIKVGIGRGYFPEPSQAPSPDKLPDILTDAKSQMREVTL